MIPVIFDLDGTLIDSAPDIHRIANAVLAGEGLAQISFAQARSFIGNGVAAFLTQALEALGQTEDTARLARMIADFEALYERSHDLTRLYPGAAQALADLARAGHPLGLCTNKPEAPTHAALAHFGLSTTFSTVVGGDSLSTRKPDPAPLLHAAAALGGGPVLYVGDSEVDAETAARAGVPMLLFTGGYRKAEPADIPHGALFDHHDALPALVARLASSA